MSSVSGNICNDVEHLFGQILFSEQKAQERRTLINEVKSKVNHCLEEIQDTEDSIQNLHGQVIVKARQLEEAKLRATWETRNERTLTDQRDVLRKIQQDLQHKMEVITKQTTEQQQEFTKNVAHFSEEYDLISHGGEARQVQWQDALQKLRAQEQHLQKDLASVRQCQGNLEILSAQNAEFISLIETETTKIKGLQVNLGEEKEEIRRLQQEKENVSKAPQTEEEFKRLQKDVDGCKDNQVETLCLSLQQELQALQQIHWQRQLQQKKDTQKKNK